jgi:hypothetical protein
MTLNDIRRRVILPANQAVVHSAYLRVASQTRPAGNRATFHFLCDNVFSGVPDA